MEKIIKEVEEIQYLMSSYRCGPDVCDYDKTLVLLEIAAEKLLMELAYFRTTKVIKEKIRNLKITGQRKAKKEK